MTERKDLKICHRKPKRSEALKSETTNSIQTHFARPSAVHTLNVIGMKMKLRSNESHKTEFSQSQGFFEGLDSGHSRIQGSRFNHSSEAQNRVIAPWNNNGAAHHMH